MEDNKGNKRRKYLYSMLAGFGALGLAIVLFFIIFRMKEFSGAVGKLVQILQPFIFGAAIAYILRPMCNWIERFFNKILPEKLHKAVSPISVTLSLIIGILCVAVLIGLIIPQLYETVMRLYKTVPEQMDALVKTVETYLERNETLLNNLAAIYETVMENLEKWIQTDVLPQMSNIVSGVGNGAWNSIVMIYNFLMGVLVSAYFLSGRRNFARQGKLVIYSIFKRDWADKIMDELRYADKMFTGFISGKIFDSIVIGIICFVFCLIARIPNAMLISVVIGFTNIIPIFGPIIGTIPIAIIILLDSPIKALWFIIFIIVLQIVDGNILGPAILGDKIGLSSFWVLFSILVFGGLFGFVGMLIGVPLFAVVYDIIGKLVGYGLDKHGYKENERAVVPIEKNEDDSSAGADRENPEVQPESDKEES